MLLKLQAVLIALAIAFANGQCLAACIEHPLQRAEMPCREHRKAPCAQGLFVAVHASHDATEILAMPVFGAAIHLPAAFQPLLRGGEVWRAVSPPPLLCSVLRL